MFIPRCAIVVAFRLSWAFATAWAALTAHAAPASIDPACQALASLDGAGQVFEEARTALLAAPRIYRALGADRHPLLLKVLAAGDDPNGCGLSAMTPLAIAITSGDLAAVDILLAHGADIELDGGGAGSPLATALSSGRLEIASHLTERGANIHAPTIFGNMLHLLCANLQMSRDETRQLRLARLMVEQGVPADAPGPRGTTPLMWAVISKNRPMVAFLLERGANPLAMNDRGKTAIDMARKPGNEQVLRLLMEGKERISAPTR
ncbi:ankyrin repeat domain-containing protein [Piscinibacter terrae]|uniref:Ankyrin repeat domain-containing protein n=1 Tax=Piscinibacter terrae TaxID=2496871 RepID=A0A3N7J254_9BURK|nr:ankyrin repeat domain-containing protein [Albitalea terrae]RQP25012.1 ankyrin repeat domain-containing protein [Albitalea terrae]